MSIGGAGRQRTLTMRQLMQLIFRQRAAEQEEEEENNEALGGAEDDNESDESAEEDIIPFSSLPRPEITQNSQVEPKEGDQSSGSKSTGKDKMEDDDEDVEFFDMFEDEKKLTDN